MSPYQIDVIEFRKTLGRFVTGVTVVSTMASDGTPRGFTANSFTSVSMDPPLVLVCIANSAASCEDFTYANGFGISILSQQQVDISVTFATAGANKFDRVRWMRSRSDNPIIEASVAWFDCAKHEMISAGDHSILLGRVLDLGHSSEAPLGFYQGRYVSLGGDVAPRIRA